MGKRVYFTTVSEDSKLGKYKRRLTVFVLDPSFVKKFIADRGLTVKLIHYTRARSLQAVARGVTELLPECISFL